MNKKQKDAIFVYGWLAWPILHFLVFWFGMNFGTIINSFARYQNGQLTIAESFGFQNYIDVFSDFFNPDMISQQYLNSRAITNTLSLIPLSLLINLPITIFFAYCIYKKIMFAKAFEIILFVPAILSVTVLCLVYSKALVVGDKNTSHGIIVELLTKFGVTVSSKRNPGMIPEEGFLYYPDTQWLFVLIFSVWTGVNGNLIYFQSAIARLPDSVFESSELDGASEVRQFFSLALPLVWPTITTMSITLVGGVFGWMLPSKMLLPSVTEASTIGLIFLESTQGSTTINTRACALAVLVAIIGGAFTIGFKALMEKITEEVEY